MTDAFTLKGTGKYESARSGLDRRTFLGSGVAGGVLLASGAAARAEDADAGAGDREEVDVVVVGAADCGDCLGLCESFLNVGGTR